MVKKKQLDKFERMVVDSLSPKYYLTHREAVLLLRQYHQEVVELVKGERLPASCCHNSDFMDGNHDAVNVILDKLKELAK